ncbi:MAG: TonB family protein [Syntrophobacteraceae bacterium]
MELPGIATFLDRGLSRGDMLGGVGASILGHIVILALAIILPSIMPRQTLMPQAYTVNLVSMQDIGLDPAPPKKGASTGMEGARSESTQSSSAIARSKSAPVVPVKRLRMDEAKVAPQADIKKLEAPDLPKPAEKPQNPASVEKDLDNLIPKPKVASKPTPVFQEKSYDAAASKASGSSGGSAKGIPEGSENGLAEGAVKGATGTGVGGSPNGAQVSAAFAAWQMALRNAIRQNWAVPEFLKAQNLEAVLIIAMKRDGTVLDLHFEKKSGQPIYDESLMRAVRKAEPLPPFPAFYSAAQEVIRITFNQKDMS